MWIIVINITMWQKYYISQLKQCELLNETKAPYKYQQHILKTTVICHTGIGSNYTPVSRYNENKDGEPN
jgi:hypothetical protein